MFDSLNEKIRRSEGNSETASARLLSRGQRQQQGHWALLPLTHAVTRACSA
jgi:hypothetical protein